MSLLILRATLAARLAVCVGFVWYFMSTVPSTPQAILSSASWALVDGELALAAALAAWRAHYRRRRSGRSSDLSSTGVATSGRSSSRMPTHRISLYSNS
jgi:hypothetical protein